MSSNFLVPQSLILSISRLKLLVSPSLHLPFSQPHFLNIHIILPILSSISLPFHLPFSEPLLSSHSFNFLFTLNLSTLRTSILPVSLITLLSLSPSLSVSSSAAAHNSRFSTQYNHHPVCLHYGKVNVSLRLYNFTTLDAL